MPVPLIPPTTSSCGSSAGKTALAEGPRYVSNPRMGRWHRPRSGVVYAANNLWPERTIYSAWCGVSVNEPTGRDDLPEGWPACGTCEGRALGHGQDPTPDGMPAMVFKPRWIDPPAWCPGGRSQSLIGVVPNSGSVGLCLACQVIVPVRARGWTGAWLTRHAPGPDLLPGCPFHGWQYVTGRGGRATCGCGWHIRETERTGLEGC